MLLAGTISSVYSFAMGFREKYRETVGTVRTAAEDTRNGIMALVVISLLSLGVALLALITSRQVLKAVRA